MWHLKKLTVIQISVLDPDIALVIRFTVCFSLLVSFSHSYISCCTSVHLLFMVVSLTVVSSCLLLSNTDKNKIIRRVWSTRFQHCIPDWLPTAGKGQTCASFGVSRWFPLPYLAVYILKLASFDLLYSKSGTSCSLKLAKADHKLHFIVKPSSSVWAIYQILPTIYSSGLRS